MIATVLNFSLATGAMALTPHGAWMYLVVCRFLVGLGVTGLYSVDITLVQEFVPASKRGWLTGLTTTMLPAGVLLGAFLGGYATPYIGWRGLFAVGLLPALLTLYIRAWVPESPHWLMRMGRVEEARQSVAWALMVDPETIPLPGPARRRAHALDRDVQVSAQPDRRLPNRSDPDRRRRAWPVDGDVVRHGAEDLPAEASRLVIWVSLSAIAGRFFCSWISDAMGRRASGVLSCLIAALFMSLAGYLHSVFIGGVSMFFVMIVLQNFMGSGNYSIVGPYMGELWPARLRGSGMGLVYGVGNLGKFIGPAGLALIAGSSNFVDAAGDARRADPGVQLFRVLVCARRGGVLVHRHRDARAHDRGNRCGTVAGPALTRKAIAQRHTANASSASTSAPRTHNGLTSSASSAGPAPPPRRRSAR